MKLSDYKGEEALEVLADLVDPVVEIVGDDEIKAVIDENNKLKLVSMILRKHKKEVIRLLAVLEREDVETYTDKVNLFTVPMKLLEIVNDPAVALLFQSQGQTRGAKFSGSVSETVEAQ